MRHCLFIIIIFKTKNFACHNARQPQGLIIRKSWEKSSLSSDWFLLYISKIRNLQPMQCLQRPMQCSSWGGLFGCQPTTSRATTSRQPSYNTKYMWRILMRLVMRMIMICFVLVMDSCSLQQYDALCLISWRCVIRRDRGFQLSAFLFFEFAVCFFELTVFLFSS